MDKKNIEIIQIKNSKDLEARFKKYSAYGYSIIDLFDEQIEELIEIDSFGISDRPNYDNFGNIILYKNLRKIVYMVPEDKYLRLLTSRNRNLITTEEQKKFQLSTVAVAGLSVGSNICTTIAMQGGSQNLYIADNDTLSTSNLNRVSYNIFDIGKNKTTALEEKLLSINPYCNIKKFSGGLNEENIEQFVGSADVVFDEIDNIVMKVKIRQLSKVNKKPVVMITDNGDNIMIDIERYDVNNRQDIFHGLLSDNDIRHIIDHGSVLTPQQRVSLSLKIVGAENAVPRMQESLLEVGRTLNTWPQLGTASAIAGSVGSYIVRKIANGNELLSGRMHVSIDEILIPNYNSDKERNKRSKITKSFMGKISVG